MADLIITANATGEIPGPDRMRQAIRRALFRSTNAVRNRGIKNVSGRFLKRRTGRLANSITTAERQRGADLQGVVGTNVFYGRVHEFGLLGPFVVRPKNAQALRFVIGGKVFFRKRVVIPGFRARPWLRTALAESKPDIERAFTDEIGKALRG